MPTNMLETVVSEKRVNNLPPTPSQMETPLSQPSAHPPSPAPAPQRQLSQSQAPAWAPLQSPPPGTPTSATAPGTTANARIKGMFARAAKATVFVSHAPSAGQDVKAAAASAPPTPPEKPPLVPSRATSPVPPSPSRATSPAPASPSRGTSPAPPHGPPSRRASALLSPEGQMEPGDHQGYLGFQEPEAGPRAEDMHRLATLTADGDMTS
jgi:hypothetical protein